MKKFYCKKCGKFVGRIMVGYMEYFLPHYYCRWCGNEVVWTKDVLERIIKREIENREV